MTIRVASYNIHGGTDSDRKPSLDQIISTLRDTDADVVLLQEIDRLLPRSGFQEQYAIVADALGYESRAFYGRLTFGPCAFGNAILSRLPVQRWKRLPLPGRGGEPRAALGAVFDQGISMWCTHLGLRHDWRETQLAALAEAINAAQGDEAAAPEAPAILGGDFNALRSNTEMEMLRERTGLSGFGDEEATFPVIAPTRRIDHLLARGFTRLNAGTREDRGSDHRLIWAEFERFPPLAANS